ncbi:PadR family transcriptional regulator [Alkalihalobacillus sp. AL-G]|uniref:PadR family transcriptional regulator n=1 Tax=Alkalihalobacillus sp. AL-G TaxID=2926399 RepID=UPI00272A962E|nr:helix-turn-helix transcriptional regulator [Alkalihalobacillus sp. AL-G]WLD92630.1 helix-turn-helix transcriptional regulator [Alkalihalobacillus sp. AL-G]
MKTELLKGSTGIILLSLLSEKDMYGYEITEKVREISEGYLKYKEGTLYPALKRLELKGLVESYWEKSTDGPRRKYYRVTKVGLKALNDQKQEWNMFQSVMHRIVGDGIVGT